MKKKKIVLIFIVLVLLWILLIIVDFVRFNMDESKPLICIYSKKEGYRIETNYGIGYSFYEEEINTDPLDIFLLERTFKLFYLIPIKEI